MGQLDPGYYWVRMSDVDDWEPAMWNSQLWVFLGASVPDDGELETPFEVGARLTGPA
jgi:hypothetical protein